MEQSINDTTFAVPLRGVRGAMAKKLHQSLQNSAQLTLHAEANISPLLYLKRQLSEQGENLSIQDLLHYVVITTLKKHMDLNAKVEDKNIVYHRDINLSFALSLDENILVTPTIFSAQNLTPTELQQARQIASKKAKNNELKPNDYMGGTITVTNLGLTRVKHFTPILNAPQIAIVGLGATTECIKPNKKGEFEAVKMMGLSLTIDHRAIDGSPAANFLSDICTHIEEILLD
jgi:pyruvate/2-oxoglutarate dehydrogenase complex dihydrolipoamide acyltransferase (E2) component